jgi:hypothetical protein
METHKLQSCRSAVGSPRTDIRDSDFMRAVNSNVRRLADALPHREELAFFCECQFPPCYSAVWMSRAAFDATTAAGGGWLLLDGHEPSAPWPSRPAPRRRARSLMST